MSATNIYGGEKDREGFLVVGPCIDPSHLIHTTGSYLSSLFHRYVLHKDGLKTRHIHQCYSLNIHRGTENVLCSSIGRATSFSIRFFFILIFTKFRHDPHTKCLKICIPLAKTCRF